MKHPRAIIGSLILLGLAPLAVFSATNEELAELGTDAMNDGRYEDAIRFFEKLVEQGPTFEGIMEVRFDLAWSYYLGSVYDKALPLFEGMTGDRAPSEDMREQAIFMRAETRLRLAEALKEDDPKRPGELAAVTGLYNDLIENFPRHPNIAEAYFSRGVAYYQQRQLEAAAKDLEYAIRRYPGSAIVADATFLLGRVNADFAIGLMEQDRKSDALPYLEAARKYYGAAARDANSRVMVAGSMFAAAETWFEAGLYREAIRYYHQLEPRNTTLEALRESSRELRDQRFSLLAAGGDLRMVDIRLNRLKDEFRRVSESPDYALYALGRIAESYFRLKRYDECRIAASHLARFATEGQLKTAWYLILNSWLEEQNPDEAIKALDGFEQAVGVGDPDIDWVSMSIGQLYFAEDRVDEALAQFERSLITYPDGNHAHECAYFKSSALHRLERFEEAEAWSVEWLKQHPGNPFAANILYVKGLAEMGRLDWEAAAGTFADLLRRFPRGTDEFDTADEAMFQQAYALAQAGRYEDAAGVFGALKATYPESDLNPQALYQQGVALESAGQLESSHAVLRQLADDYPDDELAGFALFQIGVSYHRLERYDEMTAALEEVVRRYPERPIAAEALFWMGWASINASRFDEAIDRLRNAIQTDPQNTMAPESLAMIAKAYEDKADAMGMAVVLPPDRRAIYRQNMEDASAAWIELMEQYPGTTQAAEAPEGLARSRHTLLQSKQIEPEENIVYFEDTIGGYAGQPDVQANLAAAYGSYLLKAGDQSAALVAFKEAIGEGDGGLLPPVLRANYAQALAAEGQSEEAVRIFEGIARDYADDERVLAPALYGIAGVKFQQGDFSSARNLFERVLRQFPWFEEGKNGRVKLANMLEQEGDYRAAEARYTEVWDQERGEPRIAAMLGVSRCQLAQAELAQKEGQRQIASENLRVADENLTKVIVLYEAYPDYVAEALWLKGRAYEINGEPAKAFSEAYDQLVQRFPSSEWAEKVKSKPPAP